MSGPVRLAFCIDNLGIGGTELNMARWAERLDPDRFALTIVHLSEDGPLRERLERTPARLEYLPMSGLWRPSALSSGRELARFVEREAIEVLHTQDIYSNIFAVPWARVGGVRGVAASRRWWHLSPGRAHRLANRWAYGLAHRVVANSPSVGALLVDEERVPRAKVVCVPNFVDDAAFAEPEAALLRQTLGRLGVPDGARVVGIVARLDAVKDHSTLLLAFERIAEVHADVHLLCCGEGPERGRIESLRSGLRSAGRIHLPGTVTPAFNPHRLFDLSVLCSTSEGFPNSVIEAMAAARPLVATDVGGVSDAVTHGETGLLVRPSDPHALADALSSVLARPDQASAMASRGQLHVREAFSERSVMGQLSAFYESLAGRVGA